LGDGERTQRAFGPLHAPIGIWRLGFRIRGSEASPPCTPHTALVRRECRFPLCERGIPGSCGCGLRSPCARAVVGHAGAKRCAGDGPPPAHLDSRFRGNDRTGAAVNGAKT